MEDLFSQFTFLSNQALTDKSHDPSTIEDLTKLFELESYKAWAAIELDQEQELKKTEEDLERTEEFLESEMDKAMREYYRFEEEMDLEAERELGSLVRIGESVRAMGKFMENGAMIAANRYIEGAMKSAGDTFRSAMRRVQKPQKVHPS